MERKIGKKEWIKLFSIIGVILFWVVLIYLIEYSTTVGLTFQLDRENKSLTQISEETDNLRTKTVVLSKYNRIVSENLKLGTQISNPSEADSSKSSSHKTDKLKSKETKPQELSGQKIRAEENVKQKEPRKEKIKN